MLVDFSKLNLKERPSLILRNLAGKPLQTLGYAFNVSGKFRYNETSELTFSIPAYANGKPTPHYEDIIGMRVVELAGIGQFILRNPKEVNTGIKRVKNCSAYSLEFETTFKKITLQKDVYDFWNPVLPENTILGIVMSLIPRWKLGTVDATLIGQYRTYEQESNNVFNFIKSTVQKSVGCVFEFDTLNRVINVRDVNSKVSISPIYLSTNNLLKQIQVEEDTENIFTCFDVNGADGVDIMDVNPTGTNKLYNLDYFMNETNFSPAVISSWNAWKESYENYRQPYFDLVMERALLNSRLMVEQSVMNGITIAIKQIEQMQTGVLEADEENEYKNSELEKLNTQLEEKKSEESAQALVLEEVQSELGRVIATMSSINEELSFESAFSNCTEEEWMAVQSYFKEDSIVESSFVESTVTSYNAKSESSKIENVTFTIKPFDGMTEDEPGITVTKINHADFPDKALYSIRGGSLNCDGTISAKINRGSFERKTDGSFVFSAYMGEGTIGEHSFSNGTISLTGSCSAVSDNTVPDKDAPQSYATGTELNFDVTEGHLYFTENLTEIQKRSVEWDLLEYGEDAILKASTPSFIFSVDSANFLALDEFATFKDNLKLGDKVYIRVDEDRVLKPIVINVEVSYADVTKLSITFSDRYSTSDPEFTLVRMFEQSIAMGKNVDADRFTYSSFVESGAASTVDAFINNALDVAKNQVLSSTGQAITWDENGIRLRKWNEDRTAYDPKQIWMTNNQMVFSNDGFNSAQMAIGDIKLGDQWLYGVCAPALVGNSIFGKNFTITSEKKDKKGNFVFKADENGVALHDATFDIYSGSNRHLTLNPDVGLAGGIYPLLNEDGTINKDNAKFYFDINSGNAFFGGVIKAEDFQDPQGNSMLKNKEASSAEDGYKILPDYMEMYGLKINKKGSDGKPTSETTFQIDNDGNVVMKGNLTMQNGYINWDNVGHDPWASQAKSMAQSIADGQYSGTFIDGTKIYSPEIYTKMLEIIAPENSGGGLTLKGSWDGQSQEMLKIDYSTPIGPEVNFRTPFGAAVIWYCDRTEFENTVNFNGETSFDGSTVFNGNVEFKGMVKFTGTVDLSKANVILPP